MCARLSVCKSKMLMKCTSCPTSAEPTSRRADAALRWARDEQSKCRRAFAMEDIEGDGRCAWPSERTGRARDIASESRSRRTAVLYRERR